MLYNFLYSLNTWFSPLNVFRYITFRSALAVLTAMLITFIIGPKVIKRLSMFSVTQQVRDDGPQTHLGKTGTPTMGGVLIIISILVTVVLWGDLTNKYILTMIFSLVGFGTIGFIDDYLKVVKRNPKGLRGCYKFGVRCFLH